MFIKWEKQVFIYLVARLLPMIEKLPRLLYTENTRRHPMKQDCSNRPFLKVFYLKIEHLFKNHFRTV